MAFATKEELQQIHRDLMNHAGKLNRGDSIPIEVIERISGMVSYSESWTHVIRTFKRNMRKDRGIALWSLERGAYKLLTNQEQVHVCGLKRQKRMLRQSTNAVREVRAVDPDDLSEHDRLVRLATLNQLRLQRRFIISGLRQAHKTFRSQVNPVRPVRGMAVARCG